MKAFLLSFSSLLDVNYVHTVLNNSNSVETWLSPFPFSVIIVSRLTTSELGAVLQSHFGGNLFVVVEATPQNTSGWLPPEFWDYINNPQHVWRRNIFNFSAINNQSAL